MTTTKLTTFEDFLKDIHAKDYHSTDDNMPDDFERWIENLDGNDYMEYAEKALHQQREMIRKEIGNELLKRMMKYDSKDGYSKIHDEVMEKVSRDVDDILSPLSNKEI